MSEWWKYAPSDFLLFSPRVYYRLFELNNEALWPLQLLIAALAVAILYIVTVRVRAGERFLPIGLGVIWLWVGWSFLWERYATINWAIVYVVPFFVLEALLLIGIGLSGRGLTRPTSHMIVRVSLYGMLLFSLFGYPLIAPFMGRDWAAAEIFGIAPDPTAVATLVMLALGQGRMRAIAMIIPAAWCAITGVTLWTMEAGEFFVAPLCAFTVISLAIIRRLS